MINNGWLMVKIELMVSSYNGGYHGYNMVVKLLYN